MQKIWCHIEYILKKRNHKYDSQGKQLFPSFLLIPFFKTLNLYQSGVYHMVSIYGIIFNVINF